MNDIEQSIFKTLAYFDVFDYPLSIDEVFRYLFNLCDFSKRSDVVEQEIRDIKEIKEIINSLVQNDKIGQKDDFYFLFGREEIIEIRKNRYEISLEKIKKARRVVWWLKFIPWIKAIFICSGLGLLNVEENADIDLLIITSKNRIWSARFWSAGILKILNMRPSEGNIKDKFCLSHFITEDNLNLWPTRLRPAVLRDGQARQVIDIHLIYLLTYYLPIYYEDNLWQKFIQANNWIKKYLANFKYGEKIERFIIRPQLIWLKKLICKIQFNWEERLYKKIQLNIMPKILKDMMNKDNRVIINNKMLKLHTNDCRKEIYDKWIKVIK